MDTILDFSLVKAGDGAYATPTTGLQLENLNLSAMLDSLLKATTAPPTDICPPSVLQRITTPAAPAAPALAQLLQHLCVNVNATTQSPPIGELLHLLQTGQHVTASSPNTAAYALLIQQQQLRQKQQQNIIQPSNDLNALVQNIKQFQSLKTALSIGRSPSAIDAGLFSPTKLSDRPIKPMAKRPKIEAGEMKDAELRRKTPSGAFYEPPLPSASPEKITQDDAILACDTLNRSLTCLRAGGSAPLTPSRASSLASSTSCASSTQNSPSSASLRRHSSASTAVSAAINVRGTPQRRAAAPIPDNLKDEAYFERRKKNNDAAKRSRDQRRRKEEETAQKASSLEQECSQLRTQVRLLQAENKKLHALVLASGTAESPTTFAFALSESSALEDTGAAGELTYCNGNNEFIRDGNRENVTTTDEQPLLKLAFLDSAFDDE